MGYYVESSEESTDDGQKLWNPSKTLRIINTDPGYQRLTCCGHAPSQRRRCRNPIRADNREFITRTLEEMAYLRPGSAAVKKKMRAIAGPALCVRDHQNQAEELVMQWQGEIREMEPEMIGRKSAKPSKAKRENSVKDEFEDEMRSMKDLLAELQEELNNLKRERASGRGATSTKIQQQTIKQDESETKERQQKEEAEKERLQKERLEKQRLEHERLEAERLKKEKERQQKEETEKIRSEKERLAKQRLEEERLENERLEKEKQKKANEKRQRDADNERIRLKAEKRRLDREREEREKVMKEKAEWQQAWQKYQSQWADFRASKQSDGDMRMRDAIPWPVLSGEHSDVRASTVREFFKKAIPEDADRSKLMRRECRNWHPDVVNRRPQACTLTPVDRVMIDMICREVTGLMNEAAGKSAESFE